jgi:hypothetical protein
VRISKPSDTEKPPLFTAWCRGLGYWSGFESLVPLGSTRPMRHFIPSNNGEKRMRNFICAVTSLTILLLVAFAASLGLSLSALAQGSSLPYANGAGSSEKFRRFHEDRDEFAKTGQLFKIEGHCQSACTLFLKLKNVCIEPSAELLFHAGGSAHSTSVMLASYNAKLRSYLTANHYMDTPEFHTISGSEMIQRFGYRRCPGS